MHIEPEFQILKSHEEVIGGQRVTVVTDARILSASIVADLKPGDSQLFCPKCGFTLEPNTAARPECPDCGGRLHIASEPKQ